MGTRSFAIAADVTGDHRSTNSSGAPFSSFGQAGCAADSIDCGPDNEGGAVLLAGVRFAGQEWLVAGGGNVDGNVRSVYLGRDESPASASDVIAFAPVDLAEVLDDNVHGLSTVAVVEERLYLGMTAHGSKRPRLLALLRPPVDLQTGLDAARADTCDAIAGDLCDMKLERIGGAQASAVAGVDVVAGFGGRTYVANPGAFIRAETLTPAAADVAGVWDETEPGASIFREAAVVSSTPSAVPLREKGIPALVVVGEALIAVKNAQQRPSAFVCLPVIDVDGEPSACDSASWRELPLPTQSGDRVSAVVVVDGDALLLAIDREGGAVFLRSDDLLTFVVVGEPGLGDQTADRVLGAVSVVDVDGPAVFVLLGDAVVAPRLLRIAFPAP